MGEVRTGAAVSISRVKAAALRAGRGFAGRVSTLMPYLGPAFIASIAYVDPGNFATNIQGGSRFGYTLLWVIVASNLMGMVVQALAAKLGIATGLNLAEHCRERFPRWVTLGMWAVAELAAMATDLAEFLGAALGFNLLLGIPLWLGGILTGIATFMILALERYGFRVLEAVMTAMLGIISLCYLVEIVLVRPEWSRVLHHAVVPSLPDAEAVLLATGILGATVMPHAIYLHSALVQGRIAAPKPQRLRRLFRFEMVDVTIAMTIAGLVNAAMLITAAATFFDRGLNAVATIEEANRTLEPLLGPAASWVFALSLLTAGLASSTVGTSAGQVIMQGFLRRHIPVWVRRLVTMLPSLVVIAAGTDPTRTLVISQVLLSFGLPFAIVPLVWFTSRRAIMGELVNRPAVTALAAAIAALVVALNLLLLYRTLF